MICPCCGNELIEGQLTFSYLRAFANGNELNLRPTMVRVLKKLYTNKGKITTHSDLGEVAACYYSRINQLNPALRKAGANYRVRSKYKEGYLLEDYKWKK